MALELSQRRQKPEHSEKCGFRLSPTHVYPIVIETLERWDPISLNFYRNSIGVWLGEPRCTHLFLSNAEDQRRDPVEQSGLLTGVHEQT
ncbi:hypothetical protein GJ496_006692 [Pomphorhynchus laevis]|nr:hypothetical protein GJ496_006692 [Pomphorhynchus laevis]